MALSDPTLGLKTAAGHRRRPRKSPPDGDQSRSRGLKLASRQWSGTGPRQFLGLSLALGNMAALVVPGRAQRSNLPPRAPATRQRAASHFLDKVQPRWPPRHLAVAPQGPGGRRPDR